jgi:signal transduction histidine kinase
VSGIAAGDVVVAIDGRPIDELVDQPTRRPVAAGDRLQYRVQQGETERDVTIMVRERRQLGATLAEAAPALAAVTVVLGLGLWLIRRRPEEPAAHVFLVFSAAAMSIVLGALAFLEPLDLAARPWAAAWAMVGLAGFPVLGVSMLAFALTFPSAGSSHSPPMLPWCTVPIAVMVVLGLAYLAGWMSIERSVTFDSVVGILWLLTVLAALVIALVRWRRYRHQLVARRQVQITLLGFAATIVPLLLINVIPNDLPGAWFALIVLPLPVGLATAIARHDLFELDLVLSRTLAWAICTGVLFAVYVLIVATVTLVTDDRGPWAAVPAAAAVALLFAPVREHVRRWVNHRLFGMSSDPASVMRNLGTRVSGLSEPEALMAAVVDTVTESLRLPFAAIESGRDSARLLVEQRGRPTDTVEWFELVSGDQTVGRLGVSPRRDVRTLTPADRAVLHDLARHVAVVTQLARVTNELRAAQRRTIVAREDERHRIQRDLHDRIAPALVGITLQLSVAAERVGGDCVGALLTNLQTDASRATEDLRRLVRDLRPAELEEIGLSAAVETAAVRLSAHGALRFAVEAPLRLPPLDHDVEDAAYHVCLEAMTNTLRHSGARRGLVRISTAVGGGLEVSIDDDGTGIPHPIQPGTGLASMTERVTAVGGRMTVGATETGTGTRISVLIPVDDHP